MNNESETKESLEHAFREAVDLNRLQHLEKALSRIAEGDITWADGKRRIGHFSAKDYEAFARAALEEEA